MLLCGQETCARVESNKQTTRITTVKGLLPLLAGWLIPAENEAALEAKLQRYFPASLEQRFSRQMMWKGSRPGTLLQVTVHEEVGVIGFPMRARSLAHLLLIGQYQQINQVALQQLRIEQLLKAAFQQMARVPDRPIRVNPVSLLIGEMVILSRLMEQGCYCFFSLCFFCTHGHPPSFFRRRDFSTRRSPQRNVGGLPALYVESLARRQDVTHLPFIISRGYSICVRPNPITPLGKAIFGEARQKRQKDKKVCSGTVPVAMLQMALLYSNAGDTHPTGQGSTNRQRIEA